MKDEIMLLLGCGLTALLVTNACSSMYENESEDENDFDGRRSSRRASRRMKYDDCEGYDCSSPMMPPAPAAVPKEKFSVDYYTANTKPTESISPLMFGGMVTNEPYIESDYIAMKKYTDNPDGIKTYNEKDGSVGLPVTDMTSVSAGENNKYVYDRTIGTIGFTSTKIGGRFRGQADFIRGDLPVIPDKTGWFQVSSDPANKLLLGAMNVENGIGMTPEPTSQPKGLNMQGQLPDLQDLINNNAEYNDRLASRNAKSSSGGKRMNAMSAPLPPRDPISVKQIQEAAMRSNAATDREYGLSYGL
jgi:hypothetical protein